MDVSISYQLECRPRSQFERKSCLGLSTFIVVCLFVSSHLETSSCRMVANPPKIRDIFSHMPRTHLRGVRQQLPTVANKRRRRSARSAKQLSSYDASCSKMWQASTFGTLTAASFCPSDGIFTKCLLWSVNHTTAANFSIVQVALASLINCRPPPVKGQTHCS